MIPLLCSYYVLQYNSNSDPERDRRDSPSDHEFSESGEEEEKMEEVVDDKADDVEEEGASDGMEDGHHGGGDQGDGAAVLEEVIRKILAIKD